MSQIPIRIAYLVSRYPTVTHTFILSEITGLRALGFDLDVISVRGPDRPVAQMTSLERSEHEKTFAILPLGSYSFKAHFATLLRRPHAYFSGLWMALRMGNRGPASMLFHLVYFAEAVVAGYVATARGHRHLHTHFSSTVALLAAHVFGLELSISLHGPDEFRDMAGFHMREKVAASRFIRAISHYAASQIMQASDPGEWPKIRICRLGVDTTLFSPGRASASRQPLRLLFVGRLAPVKGLPILLAACAQLLSSGWDFTLHIVGGGDSRASLEAQVAALGLGKEVIFEGPRHQHEIVALCRETDIFVLPSFAEGVPVVLMEAMAIGVPCVATWVNGIPELIGHDVEGILVAPSDAVGLALAIEHLMRDADLRERLGRAARQRVQREYNLADNTARLGDLFREFSDAPAMAGVPRAGVAG